MAIEALQILGWVLGLAIALMFLITYRQYRIDLLRYRLFVARDELFKQAEQGVISFDHPAYGMTRTTLNGWLRFAHEISLFSFFSYWLAHRFKIGTKTVSTYREKFRENVEDLSFEQKRVIVQAMARTHVAIVAHIFSTSIFFFWWAIPLGWLLQIAHKTGFIKRLVITGKKARERWSVIDGEANCIGDPHLCK